MITFEEFNNKIKCEARKENKTLKDLNVGDKFYFWDTDLMPYKAIVTKVSYRKNENGEKCKVFNYSQKQFEDFDIEVPESKLDSDLYTGEINSMCLGLEKTRETLEQLTGEVGEIEPDWFEDYGINESYQFKIKHSSIGKTYKYHPKTTDELIEAIDTEIELQGSRADLNCIDTSKITNMKNLFSVVTCDYAADFNGDVSEWDTSNVTDMYGVFYGCKSFNCDISRWDVSKVTDMCWMFCECKSFNQDLSKWNVSNVTDMVAMFYECESFNSDISDWNVSKVTNMCWMLGKCTSFNQDLSKWNVSNVTDMNWMFGKCTSFNQDLSKWNVGNVTNMRCMFYKCESFNQDLSNWDVSNVTDMYDMFCECPINNLYKPKFKK